MTKIEELSNQLQKLLSQAKDIELAIENLKEAPQEPVYWVPRGGEGCYCVDTSGKVVRAVWTNSDFDLVCLKFGNVYQTRDEAEAYVKQRKAEIKVTRRLRELEGDWKADWDNENQQKRYVCFDHEINKLIVSDRASCQISLNHWYSTMEAWLQVIEEMPNAVKTMLGVTE